MNTKAECYQRPDICTKCGGTCCKQYPGTMSPEDVLKVGKSDDMAEAVAAVLATGDYAIDWWEGDPRDGHNELDRGYFLRPRVMDDRRVFSPTWGGSCVFLTPDVGCRLPALARPTGCRQLEPQPDNNCIAHDGGKHICALSWLPYYAIIEEQGTHFELIR